MSKKKYTHYVSLSVKIETDNEEPSKEEILEKFKKVVNDQLNLENVAEYTEVFDSEEN